MANAGLVGRSFSSDIRHLRRKRALAPEASRLKSPVYLEDFCRTYPSFVRVKKSDPQISLRVVFFGRFQTRSTKLSCHPTLASLGRRLAEMAPRCPGCDLRLVLKFAGLPPGMTRDCPLTWELPRSDSIFIRPARVPLVPRTRGILFGVFRHLSKRWACL